MNAKGIVKTAFLVPPVFLAALIACCGIARAAFPLPGFEAELEAHIGEQLEFLSRFPQDDRARPDVRVRILAINDFHGQLTAGKKTGSRPAGSAPVLASYLKRASGGSDDGVFIVSAGDLVGASPPSSALLQDEPAVMFLGLLGNGYCSPRNRMHPFNNLVAVPGNHEFDEGKEELLRLAYGGNHARGPFLEDPYGGAAFPFVCANVVHEGSRRLLFPPCVVKSVKGVPIAFIGAVLKETPTIVTPSGTAGLEFLDETDSINACVQVLKRFGIRSIVAVVHQGGRQRAYRGPTDPSAQVFGAVVDIILKKNGSGRDVKALDCEVDAVISAHSHAFTNAFVRTGNGRAVLVTQAWSAGAAYADIDLRIDRRTRDVAWKSARIVTAWTDAGPGLAPDAEAAALVANAEALVAPLTNRVVGRVAADITRAQSPAGESALGNLIADAQRSAGNPAADFAFMNPGGMRADILFARSGSEEIDGLVTWGELYTVQPFGNSLVNMRLTGRQIYELLNRQWAGQPYPRVLQVSGLSYTWDGALPPGDRVREAQKGGAPIDVSAVYTVTVNGFLAEGGDGFTILKNGTDRTTGPADLDALVEYIKGLPQPFTAAIEGRIRRLD